MHSDTLQLGSPHPLLRVCVANRRASLRKLHPHHHISEQLIPMALTVRRRTIDERDGFQAKRSPSGQEAWVRRMAQDDKVREGLGFEDLVQDLLVNRNRPRKKATSSLLLGIRLTARGQHLPKGALAEP